MKTIKEARENLGITQAKMAEYLGISRPTYAAYEMNPGRLTIAQAKRVCYVLGIPYDDIFFAVAAS